MELLYSNCVQHTGVEDNLLVGGKLGSHGLPPGLEVGSGGNDTSRAGKS
jgi:hypothetical protein